MAYVTPFIDAAGLHIPTYSDILEQMLSDARSIFGSDIYLENDSQDYQLISSIAIITFDALQAVQHAYNSRSPITATGTALDTIVKINGIQRKPASKSICQVQLSGVVGTVITNGVVKDTSGYLWNLPNTVTIASNPQSAYVTCQTTGSIQAAIGDLSIIQTPTYGWTSVTNIAAAEAGQAVETDAQLRARQAISTAFPSQTIMDGLIAGIGAVSNVTRWSVYENDTNTTGVYGPDDPGHSITCVVEGGIDDDIAEQIYARKGIGCYTNGTTLVNITDAYNRSIPIRFFRPTPVPIDVALTVTGHSGYSPTVTAAIKSAVVNYLNSLNIGTNLVVSAVQYAAMAVNSNLTRPTFSINAITICKHGGSPGTSDISIEFNEVTTGSISNVTIS